MQILIQRMINLIVKLTLIVMNVQEVLQDVYGVPLGGIGVHGIQLIV